MTDTQNLEILNADHPDRIGQFRAIGKRHTEEAAPWPDYVSDFGLSLDDVPALIKIVYDSEPEKGEEDLPPAWAPVHAWRALGQLRATEAVMPLLIHAMAAKDVWQDEALDKELPTVLGMIGPAALGPIGTLLENPRGLSLQVLSLLSGIDEIVKQDPQSREEALAILTRLLSRHAELGTDLNGFVLESLLTIKAVEAIDVIRAAFAEDSIDIFVAGDLEDVEIKLGLRTARETPPPQDPSVLRIEDNMRQMAANFEALRIPIKVEPTKAAKPAMKNAAGKKVGRNAPCPCGSGKKYKQCCLP